MDFCLDEYRNWLRENVTLTDPFNPNALRDITTHILLGGNYRLKTENNTKGKLFATYYWLHQLRNNAIKKYGEDWISFLFLEAEEKSRGVKELQDLLVWLLGITHKGATNLSITKKEYPVVLDETINFFHELFDQIEDDDFINDAWLLLMAGSATLTIRGAQKSRIGKQCEKVIVRAALALLGLTQDENFWMNIGRDAEVNREADAEVETRRGRIRIELGLIAAGNQEVIEDKIGRVGRNGIVMFDKLGKATRVYNTANAEGVKLIQIRNNQPLVELYRHLEPLTRIDLTIPPTLEPDLRRVIEALPEEIFSLEELVEPD